MRLDTMFSLAGRVAVVTGGARGNGRSIARGLTAYGATVYLMDLLDTELEATCRELGPLCKAIRIDVTDASGVAEAFQTIFDANGRFDVLFNNAGISLSAPSESYSQEQWRRTFAINIDAPFVLSQLAFPHMVASKGGVIVNLTSLCSELGATENAGYVSAKGGLKMLTRALAKDWAKHNIRVNNLGLGYFHTAMTNKSFNDPALSRIRIGRTMLDRWGDEDDLAGPAVFLASDASRYMTGQDLYIDGGFLSNGI